MSSRDLPLRLARNLRDLREQRGLTQAAVAKLADLPRATWANLESGASNPTLSVLDKVARALQVSLEELISPPKGEARLFLRASLPERQRGSARVRKLLPDAIPGTEIDRFELPGRAKFVGVPHTKGTHEYLTCEVGQIRLIVSGDEWLLSPGDVVAFRGDQRHSYENPGDRTAIA